MKAASSVGVLAALILAGCHDSVAPDSGKDLEVLKLEAPSVIGPSSSANVVLTVGVGCDVFFDRIVETRWGTKVFLAAKGTARNLPPGTYCIDVLGEERHSYEIKPPLPDRFTIVVLRAYSAPPLTAEVQKGFTAN